MKRKNHLSENLKAYQRWKGYTQMELSEELGVPRSTLQALLADGNTTLETLIQLADRLNVSLDELVFAEKAPEIYERARRLLFELLWYSEMKAEQKEAVCYHVCEALKIMMDNEE